MWKTYNSLGKRKPIPDVEKEEKVARQIFVSLKRSFGGKGGRFFKKLSKGDALFETDEEGAMHSECLACSCAHDVL